MSIERTTFSTRRFLVGKAGPFPRLVFREEVMLALDQFSHLNSQGEHGGFLIGKKQVLKTAEQYEITVERFVPIPQKSDSSRLVINQDHYETVEQALKPSEEIIGWAHTHPGFGVFLSEFDKKQHQRFFSKPWQIAYVMDNQVYERAAYHMIEDEWNHLKGYYVLRDMGDHEIGITTAARKKSSMRVGLGVIALILLVTGGVVSFIAMHKKLTETEVPVEVVMEVDHSVSVQTQEQDAVRAELDSELSSNPVPRPVVVPPPTVPEVITITPPSTVPRYLEYVVERNDTLWSIAGKLWGDPSLFRLIAEENGIDNPAAIQAGQVLVVPADPRDR